LHFLLTGITGYIGLKVSTLKKKVDNWQVKEKATECGVQALLRNEIIKTYNHYMEKEYLPIYERDNLNHLYMQYKNLGGNGTIDRLMEELDDLPVKKANNTMKGERQ